MPTPKTSYARLNFKFKSGKAAFRAYRFLALGVELEILPKVEFQINENTLVVGWYGTSFKVKT
jgi:hypothetical protein